MPREPKKPERLYGCFTGITAYGRRVAFLCAKSGACRYCYCEYADIRQFKTWAEAQAAISEPVEDRWCLACRKQITWGEGLRSHTGQKPIYHDACAEAMSSPRA